MDYIGILKLICCIEKVNKENHTHELISDVKKGLLKIEYECKNISDFNKSSLTSAVPILITALKDYLILHEPLKTSALTLAYEKTNELINYHNSYRNILSKDELEFCRCMGHWGRFIILSDSCEDKQLIFKEIKDCFNSNTYIAGKLFVNELTNEHENRLEILNTRKVYSNRPKEIQCLLISEALLELKESIITHIGTKYEIR